MINTNCYIKCFDNKNILLDKNVLSQNQIASRQIGFVTINKLLNKKSFKTQTQIAG